MAPCPPPKYAPGYIPHPLRISASLAHTKLPYRYKKAYRTFCQKLRRTGPTYCAVLYSHPWLQPLSGTNSLIVNPLRTKQTFLLTR